MPPLNNRIHACIQRVMLSFDDFSIKRRYKEKTVRIIKISLENKAICAGGNRTQDAPRSGALGRGLHFPENHIYYLYTDIFTSSESFYHAWLVAMVLAYRRIIIEECYRRRENCIWQRREELLCMKESGK